MYFACGLCVLACFLGTFVSYVYLAAAAVVVTLVREEQHLFEGEAALAQALLNGTLRSDPLPHTGDCFETPETVFRLFRLFLVSVDYGLNSLDCFYTL